jgi:predicted nucleic acid-binding protein
LNFWDTSAVVALLVDELGSVAVSGLRTRDPTLLVWWGTRVECASAIARLRREQALNAAEAERAQAELTALSSAWGEVEPIADVRDRAIGYTVRHALRAADALQLAAARVGLGAIGPDQSAFVCLDRRLAAAARTEGLNVFPSERATR